MKAVKYRILTICSAMSLILCIFVGAAAVRSFGVEDFATRSRWKVDGPNAREVSWSILSQRGKVAIGRRQIDIPIEGRLEPSYWEGLAQKPEYSWLAIRLAARRGSGTEGFLQRLGFHAVDITQDNESGISMMYKEFSVPHWFVALCLLGVPIWWVILRRRRKAAKVTADTEVPQQP
jgi:hypothetical protein